MTEKYGTYYRLIGVLTDLALVNLTGYAAFAILTIDNGKLYIPYVNLGQVLLINIIWFNVSQITGLYKNMLTKEAIPTVKQSLASLLLFAGFLSFLLFLIPDLNLSERLIIYHLILFSPFFLMVKVGFLLFRRSHRMNWMGYTKVVIVGAGPVGTELYKILQSKAGMGYRVAGFFDDKPNLRVEDVNVIGRISECMDYVKAYDIQEIFCALPDRAIGKINSLMRSADKEMVRFKLVPDVKDYFHKDVNVKMLGHFPVISSRLEPLENVYNKQLKRAFDIVFSLLAVVFVISWLLPLMALLIKLESRGPIFFKQLRSGKGNEPFWCLKFRSMYVNGDADQLQAKKNDRRVTKIGAFMRKTSIDELPQFFNLLIGDMSVVGPRPHMLLHTEEYSALIEQYMVRHFLLPGITGWAQVTGNRGETKDEGAMEARVKADIWYMENWSIYLDLKIVFLTVWQVFFGDKNAY